MTVQNKWGSAFRMTAESLGEGAGGISKAVGNVMNVIIPGNPASPIFYAAFGGLTGTEFSGSGINRKLATAWHDKVTEQALKSCPADHAEFGDRVEEINDIMLEHAQDYMIEGASRHDAQQKVLEVAPTRPSQSVYAQMRRVGL